MNKRFFLAALTCVAAAFTVPGAALAQQKKELNVGFFPGPYADQFKRAIHG